MLHDFINSKAFAVISNSIHIGNPCGAVGAVLVVCIDNLGA